VLKVFLDLNSDNASAIKADLMHLILTRKVKGYITQIFWDRFIKVYLREEDVSLMQVKKK
jgi:hypothetical protein